LREKIRQQFRDLSEGANSSSRRPEIDGFEKFDDIKTIMSDIRIKANDSGIDPLRAIMLLTLPYHIIRKINNTDLHYVSVYAPDLDTMYTIRSTSQTKYSPRTYIDRHALQEYAHYFLVNTEMATISTLTYIAPSDIEIISHIYSPILKDYAIDTTEARIGSYTRQRYTKRYETNATTSNATTQNVIAQNVIAPIVVASTKPRRAGQKIEENVESDEYSAINNVKSTVERIRGELRGIEELPHPTDDLDELLKI
jgi:hypothetical protein